MATKRKKSFNCPEENSGKNDNRKKKAEQSGADILPGAQNCRFLRVWQLRGNSLLFIGNIGKGGIVGNALSTVAPLDGLACWRDVFPVPVFLVPAAPGSQTDRIPWQ
ncbi:MAG: hypothetical protein ACLUD0_18755 [Eubacterium ramulus]